MCMLLQEVTSVIEMGIPYIGTLLSLKVLVATIDAVGGDGGCRVGEVLPPCPTFKFLSYSN